VSSSIALAAVLAAGGAPVAPAAQPAATAPSIQIRVVEPDGFHWNDAAVGSLAATGLALVAVGVVLVRRRQ
jgi:hypothetical protein